MRIATTAAIGLAVLLTACNKPAEAPAASEADAATAPAEAEAPAEAAAPAEPAATLPMTGDGPTDAEEADDDRGGMGDR